MYSCIWHSNAFIILYFDKVELNTSYFFETIVIITKTNCPKTVTERKTYKQMEDDKESKRQRDKEKDSQTDTHIKKEKRIDESNKMA